MNVKMTMKVGNQTHTISEEESKLMFSGDERGFEQLMEAKGGLSMVTNMIDIMEPSQAGKRIELIMEFDDGQYIVVGRKPKEDPNYGT